MELFDNVNKCKNQKENYKITLALDEPTSFALLRIGHCYDKLNQDDLALQFFRKTVEEDALLDQGWIAITKFYMKRQKRSYLKNLPLKDVLKLVPLLNTDGGGTE